MLYHAIDQLGCGSSLKKLPISTVPQESNSARKFLLVFIILSVTSLNVIYSQQVAADLRIPRPLL
jgi:hypothetical protein